MITRSSIAGGKAMKHEDLLGFILDPFALAHRRERQAAGHHSGDCSGRRAHGSCSRGDAGDENSGT